MRVDRGLLDAFVAGDRAAAATLRPVIRKAVKAVIAKMPKAHPFADDIEQDLWTFFFQKVDKIDTSYNLEPILIATARNFAMQNLERNDMLGEREIVLGNRLENPAPGEDSADGRDSLGKQGFAGIDGREIDGVDVDVPEGSGFFEGLSRKSALEYLRTRSAALRSIAEQSLTQAIQTASSGEDAASEDTKMSNANAGQEIPTLPLLIKTGKPSLSKDVAAPERRGPARTPPGEHHRQLREIRSKLGISQIEMAKRLGIKLPTYQSYEYGKTHSIKEDVLERAHLLLQDDDYEYAREKFAGKTMRDIAIDWARRLGIDPSHISEFARVMGLNKSTISRWMSLSPEPDVWELIRYEDIVERHEKRLGQLGRS